MMCSYLELLTTHINYNLYSITVVWFSYLSFILEVKTTKGVTTSYVSHSYYSI